MIAGPSVNRGVKPRTSFQNGPDGCICSAPIVPPRRVKTREDALPLCILVRGSGIKRSRDGAKDIGKDFGVDELLPDPTIASLVQIDRVSRRVALSVRPRRPGLL